MTGMMKQLTEKEVIQTLRAKNVEITNSLNAEVSKNKVLKICNFEIMEAFKNASEENKRLEKELADALAFIGRLTMQKAA